MSDGIYEARGLYPKDGYRDEVEIETGHGPIRIRASAPQPQVKATNPKDAMASDRAPLDLIPATALVELSLAMAEGAFKYGAGNWMETGARARVYVAAMGRHLRRFETGMNRDHNGVHELARVMACCAIVIDAELRGVLVDDRLTAYSNFEELLTAASETVARLRKEFAQP